MGNLSLMQDYEITHWDGCYPLVWSFILWCGGLPFGMEITLWDGEDLPFGMEVYHLGWRLPFGMGKICPLGWRLILWDGGLSFGMEITLWDGEDLPFGMEAYHLGLRFTPSGGIFLFSLYRIFI